MDLESSFQDLKLWLYSLVHRFHNRYGGDLDDLTGQAFLLFIKAFYSYDPSHNTKLITWVGNKVWRGLQDYCKKGWSQPTDFLEEQEELPFLIVGATEHLTNWLTDFLDMLDEDARQVVNLVVGVDENLAEIVQRIDGYRVETRALYRYLFFGQHWTEDRIYSAFKQIGFALAGFTPEDFSWQICFKE